MPALSYTSASAEQTLAALLTKNTTSAPEAVALLAPGRPALLYKQLLTQTHDVGSVLSAQGIGRHDRVAIVLPNGPEMALTFLAVSTWAASAPLNPAYHAEEFDFYLADLNAKALIIRADEDSPARVIARARGIQVLELTPRADAAAGLFTLTGESHTTPVNQEGAQAADVALLLHTSGTTSRPKLVPLTQSNICASAHNIATTLALQPHDRCLNVMPLFHIHGLMGALVSSLAAGASVVCTPGFSAPHFVTWVDTHQPTWYTAVPTMHQAILAQVRQDTVSQHSLRFIRSSSASLPLQVIKELEESFRVPVIEAYGMTEATHQMTSNPLPPLSRKPGSVGKAAGPEIAVMDETGLLLPAETPGEEVIRGTNVTRGYADNPAANATAFANGWFRTGDQGYLDAEGYLFLTGRLKEMINRGGEKIAPREVDEVLLTHPAVVQAVTFAVPHPTLGEDVAAAVVLRPGQHETASVIRQFLFGRVADFKIPSQVVIVTGIPKGPTGKIQRIGLATKLALQLKGEFVAPQSDIEKEIARIYADVLGIDQVGITDNFFALGGDSLLAAQLISRVRASFAVVLPLRSLFETPTVAGLATSIESLLWATEEKSSVTVQGNQREIGVLTTFEFLSYLRKFNIEVRADGDHLDCGTPNLALPTELQREVSKRKADILSFLRTAKTWTQPVSSLIPLQPAGNRPAFFGVPGHNGDVFCFMPLTRHLGPEQPFYGLQPPGSDGKCAPLMKMEELAAYFVNDIRAFQPEGPYLIGGYCLGGFIAFEIAQQLYQAGQKVALLALFGTQSPSAMKFLHRARVELRLSTERVVNVVKTLRRLGVPEEIHYLLDKMKQRQLEKEERAKVVSLHPYRPLVEEATVKAVRGYKPRVYPDDISLFLPNQHPTNLYDGRLLEWQQWTPHRCDSVFGPPDCTGNTMLREPYVTIFADLLRSRIDQITGTRS